jgi:hypothetical protein
MPRWPDFQARSRQPVRRHWNSDRWQETPMTKDMIRALWRRIEVEERAARAA